MDAEMDNIFLSRSQVPARRNWLGLSLLGLATLIVGALAGSAMTAKGWMPFKNLSGTNGNVPIYVAAEQRANATLTLNNGFSAIAKAVTPAVVTVNVQSRAKAPQSGFFDPFDFFNGPETQPDEETPRRRTPQPRNSRPAPLRPSGLGSGVIVSPDGYIITNNHVVDEADKVEVQLHDGRTLAAKVVGTDERTDVAVLKVEATGLPTLPFGDSDKAEVGDLVLAVGNPLGVGQTVTMGIISAKSRSTTTRFTGDYQDFIQTDAPINRGNSGGALVNLNGELIGVPSQIYSSTGGSIGIGFAIPARMARNVMDQLIKGGKVRRGMLGINLNNQWPSEELAKEFGYNGTKGALVDEVTPGSPAEKAGVKNGDIITEYQGQRIEDNSNLRNMVSQTSPGSPVKFKIWRNGTEREMTATLTELTEAIAQNGANPRSPGEPESGSSSGEGTGALSGIKVGVLTPEIARGLNLPATLRGVVIIDVDPDSPAADAGLRPRMVIEEIGRQSVTNLVEFNDALKKVGNRNALLRVRTQNGSRFVVIKAQE